MTKRKSRKNLREHTQKPQKMKWSNHKTFNTFDEASAERVKLLETQKNVKIKRSGPDGVKFTVKIGKLIKENKQKKGEEDASE